jgi:hypothetical protein
MPNVISASLETEVQVCNITTDNFVLFCNFKISKSPHMIVLQIEHPVPNFEGWKRAFDSDPMKREQSGVKRYKIFRQTNDSNYVVIELEFDDLQKAEIMFTGLQKLWNQVEGTVMTNAKAKIIELVESKEY